MARMGPLVGVLDYGAANMVSVGQALALAGARVTVVAAAGEMADLDAVVVPGVGAARYAMTQIRGRGLADPLRDWIQAGRPCLGICLGYQILFERSDEGDVETLGLLAGRTVELRQAPKLPHIGWNSVDFIRAHPVFAGVANGTHFYFVHSFAPEPADDRIVIARTAHGGSFVSAVASGNLIGLQFHPEKSAEAGHRVLANWLARVRSSQPLEAAPAARGRP